MLRNSPFLQLNTRFMSRFFFIFFLSSFLFGCISTAPQQNSAVPGPVLTEKYSSEKSQVGRVLEKDTGPQECEAVPALTIRTKLLAGINQLRRQGCDCMGVKMPKVKALKWDDSFVGYASGHSKRTLAGEIPYQPVPSSDITAFHYEALFSFQNEGAKDVARLMVGIQIQTSQCQAIMKKDFTKIGASKQGCYWTVVLQ